MDFPLANTRKSSDSPNQTLHSPIVHQLRVITHTIQFVFIHIDIGITGTCYCRRRRRRCCCCCCCCCHPRPRPRCCCCCCCRRRCCCCCSLFLNALFICQMKIWLRHKKHRKFPSPLPRKKALIPCNCMTLDAPLECEKNKPQSSILFYLTKPYLWSPSLNL